MADILIIDDDPQIREVLRIALKQAGHVTREAGDGAEGLTKAQNGRDDLVILDIGLPAMDGIELCRKLRTTSDVPVLFLTARDDEIDKIIGLEIGGDDYMTKPFSPRELTARVRAILKRTTAQTAAHGALTRGMLSVDPNKHLCRFDTQDLSLTQREMALLSFLMARPDNVYSRVQISDAVYGPTIHVSDRTIDSHLRNLRAKLADIGATDAIETVHGVGVRMGTCQGA
ncbi:response regulator transcription factor [Lentibacter algarum]|uniref:response regulator transcription factor n=1 Tax=Lentibacter algarum TaxID=576131 RepID=UPI001C07D9C5|nr:response regulator transcription factor [Lentibacter algarum]MBU2980508.1 response regulator transcription factor [Lentibacter algarum]